MYITKVNSDITARQVFDFVITAGKLFCTINEDGRQMRTSDVVKLDFRPDSKHKILYVQTKNSMYRITELTQPYVDYINSIYGLDDIDGIERLINGENPKSSNTYENDAGLKRYKV